MAETDEQLQLLDYLLSEADPLYWIRHHGWIKDERTGRIYGPGLNLWPGQEDFLRAVIAGSWVITGKARQIGISWLLRLLECWALMFQPNVRLGIIDKDEDGAKTHLLRVQWVYEQQPHWLSRRTPIPRYMNTQRFGLADSGGGGLSVIEAHPCTARAARGLSGKRIVCEEFAFWPNYEVWPAIIGTTSDGGQVVIASTANGDGNKYHEIWQEAELGTGAFAPMFFSWRTHPERDDAWYRNKLIEMGSLALMRQEFPDSPDEMFRASGTPYFDRDLLGHLENLHAEDPARSKWPEVLKRAESLTWRIYREPVPGRLYVIGADVADGGGDACSADVLDVETGEQVAHLHAYSWKAEGFADHLFELGKFYNWAVLAVERNLPTTLTVLIRVLRYPRIWRQPHWDPARKVMVPEAGWETTGASRPLLFGGIERVLSTMGLTLHDKETFRQLRLFQHNPRTKRPDAPDGDHDDAVISLGIAQQARATAHLYQKDERVVIYHGNTPVT